MQTRAEDLRRHRLKRHKMSSWRKDICAKPVRTARCRPIADGRKTKGQEEKKKM
jgi:hypothetical protein